MGIAARPSAVSRRPSQPGLVERSAYVPDETVGECVPRAIRDLEDGVDMRLREIVGHRDQPVLLIDRGLLSPIELLVADRASNAAPLGKSFTTGTIWAATSAWTVPGGILWRH